MASIKPKYLLSIDWETSGSSFSSYDETTRLYQGISFGAVVAETETLEVVDTLYQEIKFEDDKFTWTQGAQDIHGLTREYLEANGVNAEEAAVALGTMVLKYFGNTPVMFSGHNVEFDIAFTKQLMQRFNIMFEVSHRKIDTAGIGFALFNITKSDELYYYLGLPERAEHNALEDALMTVQTLQIIRSIVSECLGQ